MKKYIITISLALITGSLFSFYMLRSLNENSIVATSTSIGYIFQLGVFENIDNANKFIEDTASGIVVKEDNYYYVYSAIYTEDILVNTLELYYKNNNINYFIKEKSIPSNIKNEINEYEKLLVQTNDINVIFKTNQIILDKFALSI